jgi:hypothetical protein
MSQNPVVLTTEICPGFGGEEVEEQIFLSATVQ